MSGVLREFPSSTYNKYASDENSCAAPVKNKRDFVSDLKNKGTQLAHRINALFMNWKHVWCCYLDDIKIFFKISH